MAATSKPLLLLEQQQLLLLLLLQAAAAGVVIAIRAETKRRTSATQSPTAPCGLGVRVLVCLYGGGREMVQLRSVSVCVCVCVGG